MRNKRFLIIIMILILVLLSAQFCLQIRLINDKKEEKYKIELFSSENYLNLQLGEKNYRLFPGEKMNIELRGEAILKITQEKGGSYKIRRGNNLYLVRIPVVEVKLEHGKD